MPCLVPVEQLRAFHFLRSWGCSRLSYMSGWLYVVLLVLIHQCSICMLASGIWCDFYENESVSECHCYGSDAHLYLQTKNKVNAAALETYLLKTYDYAWNKGSNGERRPEHAFRKLQHITKSRAWYVPSKWTIKLDKMKVGKVRNLRERRIALIAVKEKLWRLDNPATRLSDTAEVSFKFLFFFWRRQEKKEKSLPSFPQHCSHIHDGHLEMRSSVASVCGIVDVSGMICKKAPVPGRKRCNEHKGMRLCLRPADDSSILAIKHFVTGPTAITVCGIIDGCGIVCKDMPLPGRKRCKAHKGMRICFRPGNDPDKEASCNGAK